MRTVVYATFHLQPMPLQSCHEMRHILSQISSIHRKNLNSYDVGYGIEKVST